MELLPKSGLQGAGPANILWYDTPSWLAARKARTSKERKILAHFSITGFRGQRMEPKKCSIAYFLFPNLELAPLGGGRAKSSRSLRLFRFQIAKQVLESFRIRIVVLPVAE